ncbi:MULTISPECIES: hypothetical protein [Streptomyces]|uniref:hypothetical protein n=1 Tax=Streptomyces TaxID=1883 RepID=UPI0007CD4408|nr:hypothetical protein A4V12_10595 [Streptomyces noursei]
MFGKPSHRRSSRAVVTVGAVCALALGTAASPAAAGTHSWNSFGTTKASARCTGDIGSQGRFLHDGDRFWIEDVCGRDGLDAVLLGNVTGDSAPEVVVWATGGGGDENSRSYDVPEGRAVHVRACVGDRADDAYWGCGTWERGVA